MKNTYYLAIDIGASSGRHILGWLENGTLKLREVYRFPNGMTNVNGHLYWDCDALLFNIKEGLKKCRALDMIPSYVGIDTWGVDYVLLDSFGKRLGNAFGYRDNRTQGMDKEVYTRIQEKELYLRTGIQKAIYNTVYQLMAVEKQDPDLLRRADTLLMTPDYFNYLLTGVKCAEYTISTTTQLVDPQSKGWDYELIEKLNFPKNIFQKIRMPGTVLAPFSDEVRSEVGYNCNVVLVPSHDTASAVLAVPFTEENSIYISSGTWSLMGAELKDPIRSETSYKANFTNEGGYGGTIRFLKNIMGLWMIQFVRQELHNEFSFSQLCDLAEKASICSLVDVDDERFFAPVSMIEAIRNYCAESGQHVPQTAGELASVIYRSLAKKYAETTEQIEGIIGMNSKTIHIVGGGCNADYLNRLTAKASGKAVLAGPSESTAIGNICSQMLCSKEIVDVAQARKIIFNSFDLKRYH